MNFNEEASLGTFIHNTWPIDEASLSRNQISTISINGCSKLALDSEIPTTMYVTKRIALNVHLHVLRVYPTIKNLSIKKF